MSSVFPSGDALATTAEHLVVLVAHPDDESFGCGSLIARAAAAGAQVTVVCATLGEAGERRPDTSTDHLPLATVRERELHAAADVLGVTRVVLLGHLDSGFDGPAAHGTLCAASPSLLSDEVEEQLRALRADVVLTLDGSDGHRDHVRVRDAVIDAASRIEPAPRVVLASLANSLMRRWAGEMQELRPDLPYLDLDVDALGRPDGELTALDATTVLGVRERAIACHRSQPSPFDGLSATLRRAFLDTDFVVEVPSRVPR